MTSEPLQTSQDDVEIDRAFYERVAAARGNASLRECRLIASRSRNQSRLRAFVAAMFTTEAHRKEISSCIRNYIGIRAIPSLLWNLHRLPPSRKLFQARLLCVLGHYDSFNTYYRALEEIQALSQSDEDRANTRKSVEWFMTNYAPKLISVMRRGLASGGPGFVVFCAPYLFKYEPREVSAHLAAIACDPATDLELQEKSLLLLATFSPEAALACLFNSGESFTLPLIISILSRLSAAEEFEVELCAALEELSKGDGSRALAARLFSKSDQSENRQLQFAWITQQVQQWLDAGAQGAPAIAQPIATRLCRLDHPDWVRYLETAARNPPEPLAKFARTTLLSARHPAGLRILLEEITSATRPEDLFRPCINAIQTYREVAIDVLETVAASENPKLIARIEQVVSATWPGKTVAQVLAEHKESRDATDLVGTIPEATDTDTDSSLFISPTIRIPQRTERITIGYARDRGIVRDVKAGEDYCCQICGRRMINARTGQPYAESHHVQPLGHDGSDTIDNLLCLCTLCHTLFHLGCVGVDQELRIHLSICAKNEVVLPRLRVATVRQISRTALRHHWTTMFFPPEDVQFDERDPDDD